MSDGNGNYNIKIGVDGRSAQQGLKQFTAALADSFKALREFDKRGRSAFEMLDKMSKTNVGNLGKQMRGTAQALDTLNKVKISKALINNLQMLQKALVFRFNADAIKRVPEAMTALSRVRIDGSVITGLQHLKAALIGFKAPPAGAVRNLANLTAALNAANPSRIEATARALSRLNGLTIRASRASLPNFAAAGSGLASLRTQLLSTTSAATLLGSALAGISATAAARGIFESGTAFQTLQRTLGAVATSSSEVGDQLRFLTDLTSKLPVSLEAAAASYGRFSIAARLSGITVKETQDTFAGFSTAFAAMGVGAEGQKRAFDALIQIFSKGKIQAEEWRQQIGDHMPGAFALLAESMGVTTAQLSKMMDEGKVLSSELPKLATLLQSRFGPSLQSAMQRAGAQLTALGNEWTTTTNIIFNSGFESGLATLAKSLADALKTDAVRDFARDFGRGLETAMTYMAAFVKTLANNSAVLRTIMGGIAVAISAALAKSLLFVLGPAIGFTVTAFKTLGKAALFAQARILAIPAALTIAAVALDQFANGGRATAAILEKLSSAAKQVGDGLSGIFQNLAGTSLDEIGDDFAKSLKEAQDYASKIQNSPLFDPAVVQRNSALEAENNAKKLAALTDAEQKVWDEVNAIGKANAEYLTQLKLLDEIGRKKGIDPEPFKRVLAAQTLDDRDPIGALVRDYRAELAAMQAKTGEQQALNRALEAQNDLVKKGIVLNDTQAQALKDYQLGIAKMNGEIGNGIERWTAQVGDWNANIQEAIANGISGLSDELTNFLTGAESDFAGLARSILKSFVKISLDSLLKDMFTAMGMNGATNGASQAEAALAKLANIGGTINTAMTQVYTSGLSINGLPIGGAGSLASSPELPANRERLRRLDELLSPSPTITRAPLPPIPGTNVASPFALGTNRFPLEDAVPGLRGSYGAAGAFSAQAANLNLRGALPLNFGGNAGRTISLSPAEIIDLKKTVATEWVQSAGQMQGRGIIDTILNRKASGRWGDSITDVVNARSQFSDINGRPAWLKGRNSVDDLPMSRIDSRTDALVNDWLSKRMGGAGSTVGDNLNYANPYWSDKVNRGWIDRLQGPTYGIGKAIHQHGTTPDLERFRPGAFGVSATGIDPSVTGPIDALNAKLQTVSATAAQAAPAFDTLRAANQNMATASTMAGTNVMSAGTMASAAGPQFQHAGTSIMSAGQQAAMAGQTAQTATPGLSGFGGGISQLLGPLASAIPGLGQFGSMIMQLVSQLFSGGGGGGLFGGLFSEGGYSDSPVTRARMSAGLFANAPHFAEGTGNTSGGMPAILHDNEAVIPLSRGRKVPVEMSGNDNERRPMLGEGAGRRPNVTLNFHGVRDADTFRASKREMLAFSASAGQKAMLRNL